MMRFGLRTLSLIHTPVCRSTWQSSEELRNTSPYYEWISFAIHLASHLCLCWRSQIMLAHILIIMKRWGSCIKFPTWSRKHFDKSIRRQRSLPDKVTTPKGGSRGCLRQHSKKRSNASLSIMRIISWPRALTLQDLEIDLSSTWKIMDRRKPSSSPAECIQENHRRHICWMVSLSICSRRKQTNSGSSSS